MALLHAGKAHRRSKREGLLKGTAALIAIAIISSFSLLAGTSWNRISCQSSVKQETSSTDLVVQVIRSITILAERSRRSQLRLDKSSGDADAPGEVFQLDGVYLSSVPRVVRPTLDGRMQASVPLTIWQSVPNHDGNSLAMSTLFNSWTVQHPEWDHFLFDEGEMSVYVENHFGPDVADLYWSMPFDRMRAEAFRYMVLFHQGGVHADADTLCVLPAPAWAPRGCQFAAAAAGPDSFEPSAIASVAGHAVLHTVLELMVERMQALEELMRAGADLEDLAYNTTGPGVFTDGIAMHVGLEQVEGQPADVSALLAHQAELRRAGVCLLTADEMQDCIVKVDASWDDSGALLAINA